MPSRFFLLAFLALGLSSPTVAADYTEPLTGLEFVRIPAGNFDMGDLAGSGLPIEKPARKVTLREFYLGRYEVTFDQYDRYCEETGRKKPADEGWGRGNRPVVNVSWHDAVAFADWLTKKTGRTFRLPSEAEWEYAARGGRTSEYWWGNEVGSGNANCRGCGSAWDDRMTAPVGSFTANPYGLFDMHGNVYEWCRDLAHETYRGAPPDGSAWERGETKERVLRSGSFMQPPFESRARARNWDRADAVRPEYGFRLLLEP